LEAGGAGCWRAFDLVNIVVLGKKIEGQEETSKA